MKRPWLCAMSSQPIASLWRGKVSCYLLRVSFTTEFNALPLEALIERSLAAPAASVRESMSKPKLSLNDFAHLISPAATQFLEPLSARSQQMTQQRFGK